MQNDTLPRQDFIRVSYSEPHTARAREILAAHPEIRNLFGVEPMTAVYGTALVLLTLMSAPWFGATRWWVMLLSSYVIGATIHHALWVLIHDCTHDLAFRPRWGNRLLGIFFNLPHVAPTAMPFFKYHMLHHVRQGDADYDADVPNDGEAKLVGNSWVWKMLSLLFFGFVQGTIRPARLKNVRFMDPWIALNMAVSAVFVLWMMWAGQSGALIYLSLSTFWGLGLHPLGGRWIAEHYVVSGSQETNSYYGPLNRICFNMGYHNEHHDLMRVPWSRLPLVRKMAPEFYDPLFSYQSWTWALVRFIFSNRVTLYDRVVRRNSTGR